MSRCISLEIDISKNDAISVRKILSDFENAGWRTDNCGEFFYLPENDALFDWTSSRLTREQFISIVEKKEQKKETIGVVLYWENTEIGVSMHIKSKWELSFLLNINTKFIEENKFLVDYNWYAERIIPVIGGHYFIEYYSFAFAY